MTSALHQQVRRTIRRHELIPEGARVVVALSGGSDSVALTLLLRDLARHGDFQVAGLAHFNHQLRPTASRDEIFCRGLARRLAMPFFIDTADIRGEAAATRSSVEDVARRCRYAFLERVAAELAADRIAVGHTQDDQAETFLMKLIRGAGLAGLGGVYPRRGMVIRPLLDSSRAELRSFLLDAGETWVDDESNADVANPRNRIRHHVLPELNRTLGGESRPNLARAAAIAREDSELLDELADTEWDRVVTATPDGLSVEGRVLASLPGSLKRRIALRALRQVSGDREVTQQHVDAFLAVARGESAAADVAGGRVELRAGKAVLLKQSAGRSDTLCP